MTLINKLLFIVLIALIATLLTLGYKKVSLMPNEFVLKNDKWRCVEYIGRRSSENCVLYRKEVM